MGLPGRLHRPLPAGSANPPKGNIRVGGGKEINRDSLSSGERKGRSPNRIPCGNVREMWSMVEGGLVRRSLIPSRSDLE